MRIYGNRQLKTLPGQATRPTASRVREAVFNIWRGNVVGCCWLDLCAGSGSMGAEALCRGAGLVVGIEQSGRACALIRQNWQPLAQSGQEFHVLRGDVLRRLRALRRQFDRIYFDPPYASGLYQPVLEAIAHHHLLAAQGEIAVEYSPKLWQPASIARLDVCRVKEYGKTSVVFYSQF
ncbi:MAG: 16S rRNA (guanine(966)-N(2))-methyltransferase RsmD [Cyanophyceae cyanobacterium]